MSSAPPSLLHLSPSLPSLSPSFYSLMLQHRRYILHRKPHTHSSSHHNLPLIHFHLIHHSSCCNIEDTHTLTSQPLLSYSPSLQGIVAQTSISESIRPSNKIWINVNKHTFVGGDIFKGTVEMDCLVPFTARGVNIKFTGYSSPSPLLSSLFVFLLLSSSLLFSSSSPPLILMISQVRKSMVAAQGGRWVGYR